MISAAGGSILFSPVIGLGGYLASYNLNPSGFWWGSQVPGMFQRYSLIFATSCFIGIVIHWHKLKVRHIFESQLVLLWMFAFIIWISEYLGLGYLQSDSNAEKMLKVTAILSAASLLITDFKVYKALIWIYILTALYSGYESWSSQSLSYIGGRLQAGVGGSDFNEGNFLAAHYVMILPWIGIVYLKGDWKAKIVTIIAAAMIVNSLILIESRGAFLAIACGVCATLIMAGWKYKKKVITLLTLGLMGLIYLSDATFWERMNTIETSQSSMDRSAIGRIEAWQAAMEMFNDHPLGIGEGRFKTLIGDYNARAAGRDTHNTFFRCIAELGIQGITVLLLMIVNAFWILSRIKSSLLPSHPFYDDYNLHILALRVALIMYLITTMFLSHTYIEEFYWLLMFPLFLKKCFENEFN